MLAVVALFLLAMAALGMFGRLRLGGPRSRTRRKPRRAARCPECGRHRVGPGPCECGRA